MFTLNQISAAHSKVKSGADFPNYIQEIIQLGVTGYETFVTDGHTIYRSAKNDQLQTDTKYPALQIAAEANKSFFQQELKAHQQGKTSYPDFCNACAASGVERWVTDLEAMTCTYFDKAGNKLLTEIIPGVKPQ